MPRTSEVRIGMTRIGMIVLIVSFDLPGLHPADEVAADDAMIMAPRKPVETAEPFGVVTALLTR